MSHDYKHDAEALHKAISGAGTDEKVLVDIIGSRSKNELAQIAKEYEAHFKKSLAHDLAGDTSYNFKELLCWRVLPNKEVRKQLLLKATKGAGTAEKYLIDVLGPASNAEILELYQHDPAIVASVLNDVSHGNFAKVIHEVLKGKRDENPQVDEHEAEKVAEILYKAGEGKLGTDEKTFNDIITTRGWVFLQRVSAHYAAKHKHPLETAIKKETSGNYEDILIALVQHPLVYYADRLYNAMHGLGTDERALNYVFGILSREDLKKVGQLFQERHKDTLEKYVKGDTSGHYRDLLVALLH